MDYTPRLGLPYIAAQQAQKQVTYNEAMKVLDTLVQPAVESRTTTAPPGAPADGDAYIVPVSATGGWSGKDGKIAVFGDGGWTFRTAEAGWLAYVVDAAEIVIWSGSAWTQFVTNGGSALSKLGINATADLTNRLSVASASTLFSHDGTDHRIKINKSAAGSTASVLLQDAFSGRAEFGLAGDDDFHLKVSPDGSSWTEALTIARSGGKVTLGAGQLAFPATQNASSGANVLDDYEEGSWTPAMTFGGGSTGITYQTYNAGRYIKVGKVVHASAVIALSNKGSSTGAAVIGGLPFAALNQSTFFQTLTVGAANGMSGITESIGGVIAPNASSFGLNTPSITDLANTNFTNTSFIALSATYEVN